MSYSDEWKDFLGLLNEKKNPGYRVRVKPKRLKSDMGAYGIGSSKGSKKAQAGSPFKKAKVSFKGKGFNDISGTALEEEVEPESFEMHDELQPEIWRAKQMWPEVHARLLAIAKDFITESLENEIGKVNVEDIRLTGSLANYNWSKYSDVDLHLVVDFTEIDEDTELVKGFFDAVRARWNSRHDIDIYGFKVEIYLENVGDVHHSSGVYSVLNDTWIVEPDPQEMEVDFVTARRKSDDVETTVNLIDRMVQQGKLAASLKSIERLKAKIRRMRQAGLESPAREFSSENIAFKILRRNGTLDRLGQLRYDAYDRHMSLKENTK
jgi:hypothetical protein